MAKRIHKLKAVRRRKRRMVEVPDGIDRFLSTGVVAAIYGKSRVTIWRWEREGRIPAAHWIGPNSRSFLSSEIAADIKRKAEIGVEN